MLPNISTLKISELKEELHLYGIDSAGLSEKQDLISALKTARETLPRPVTTYREPELPTPQAKDEGSKEKQQQKSSSAASATFATSATSKPQPQQHQSTTTSGHHGSSPHSSQTNASKSHSSTQSQTHNNNNKEDKDSSHHHKEKDSSSSSSSSSSKKAVALRSPVIAKLTVREHPSAKVLGERNSSFLPGSPFSFALKGSLHEEDAAVIRIPEGVCLTINVASVDRKEIATYLTQNGSIGISLKLASEENPQLLPVWTFDKDKTQSYTVSDLGIRICGPRSIRLLAYMEMGLRSNLSVDVFVFGSVGLDKDKF